MLSWPLWKNKQVVVGLGLVLLLIATHVEAGVFGWLKRTEMQWSPEVKGVITEHGTPVAGLEVKRYLYRGDKKHNEVVKTNAAGEFFFPRKTIKVRPHILYEINMGIEIFVLNHAYSAEEVEIFGVNGLNDLDYKSLDLVLSDMHCQLELPYQLHRLKNLEILGNSAPSMGSKCSFTHAATALYSEEEVQQMQAELESQIEVIDNR